MNRNARIFCFLALALGALSGCSSGPPANEAKKAAAAPDKIVGKAQVLIEAGGATDAALNAGGSSSVYLWQGERRFRLFLMTPVDVIHGSIYVVEGIYAQKAIDEIGDPDQGKHGYPLQASCRTVVGKVWGGLAMDEAEADATVLRTVVQRYPARAVFLVSRIRPATPEESAGAADVNKEEDKNIVQVSVAPEKQRALLIEGPNVQTAPLWAPEGGTVKCSVIINPQGRIASLETGVQLCESVPWSQFRYQPPVQNGKPVKVETEVEVRFDPRK